MWMPREQDSDAISPEGSEQEKGYFCKHKKRGAH